MRIICLAITIVASTIGSTPVHAQPADAAQARRAGSATIVGDHSLFVEAEDFQPDGKGWSKKPFGTNYYAATFANAFLSRKAYLGASEQTERTVATATVSVPKAGKFQALVRYEAAYRFETEFTLEIEQNGVKQLTRLYGSRNNVRIWAFNERLKKEVAWTWGAGENVVWEGHDAFVDLAAGPATLRLIADKQPEPAARRNVDLVMLTTNAKDVANRIAKEAYLPLDGLLTQAGDVFVKVKARDPAKDVKVAFDKCTEHSPYWVHMRTWKSLTVVAKAGQTSEWTEVGHLLDTLSDGQWNITGAGGAFDLTFGLKTDAKMETIRTFENLTDKVVLAFDADTRTTRRIRLQDEVLYELVDYLKKHPVKGVAPKRTLIYGFTFPPKKNDAKYSAALEEFLKLTGATALGRDNVEDVNDSGLVRGYIDVRGVPTPKLEEYCKNLAAKGRADKIASVSLGDEIGLEQPPANGHKAFAEWCQSKGLKPAEVNPAAAGWDQVKYDPSPKAKETNPRLYYFSKSYSYRYGIAKLKERTDILKRHLPNAGIGANFSPHHKHMYLGDTHHWISVFREGGMTMPWGEDYIWQVPVASSQINDIMVDMYRCAVRPFPKAKIHYYVMPHTPNNTPDTWRRIFYSTVGHGAKIINLFEYRPVQFAYTENHTSDPAMYQEVRKSLHELGKFEDIVQDGHVRPANVAFWLSEAGDVWEDHAAPFDANLRCLYLMVRKLRPVDFVVDGDDLKDYKMLVLCDAHVSQASSKRIADWVKAGGKVLATAGAGMFDEFNQPNKVLRDLVKADFEKWIDAPGTKIVFEKQDLPFAEPAGEIRLENGTVERVFGKRAVVKALPGGTVPTKFTDGTPAAIVARHGSGMTFLLNSLLGLDGFKPAFPKRPMDRGANKDSMTHFLPSNLTPIWISTVNVVAPRDREPGNILPKGNKSGAEWELADEFPSTRTFGAMLFKNSDAAELVAATAIDSPHGTAFVLANWSHAPIKKFRFGALGRYDPTKISLASGNPVEVSAAPNGVICTFELVHADALILRK